MRASRSFLSGVVAASLLFGVPAAMAASDGNPIVVDGTSPALTLNPTEFVVGSSIDAAGLMTNQDPTRYNFAIPVKMSWTTSDQVSGIDAVDVYQSPGSNTPLATVAGTSGSYAYNAFDYDGTYGGGAGYVGDMFIVSRDVRGNGAFSRTVGREVTVWDEGGLSVTGTPLPVTRTGTWRVSTCACWNHGYTAFSTTAGNSMTFTVTATRPAKNVAVVMAKNTNRGVVQISVDGGTSTSIDTYAATPTHRVVVWQRTLSVGTHTIRLRNAGTPGRSRIDVDTIMMTPGEGGPPGSITWVPEG